MKTKKTPPKKQKQPVEKRSEQREPIFAWTADEYIQQERGKQWFLIAGIIVALAVIYAVFTSNWTLAIAVVVIAAVYEYIRRHHPPKKIEIKITDLGIHVGHMFFPYNDIQAFWILYGNGLKTLNFRVHRRMHSNVVVQLDSQDPAAIRTYLAGQIPEWEGKGERLTDVLIRLLKL